MRGKWAILFIGGTANCCDVLFGNYSVIPPIQIQIQNKQDDTESTSPRIFGPAELAKELTKTLAGVLLVMADTYAVAFSFRENGLFWRERMRRRAMGRKTKWDRFVDTS